MRVATVALLVVFALAALTATAEGARKKKLRFVSNTKKISKKSKKSTTFTKKQITKVVKEVIDSQPLKALYDDVEGCDQGIVKLTEVFTPPVYGGFSTGYGKKNRKQRKNKKGGYVAPYAAPYATAPVFSASCLCLPGYTGTNCTEPKTEGRDECVHGVISSALTHDYFGNKQYLSTCTCFFNWQGPVCNTTIPLPLTSSSTCLPGVDGVNCNNLFHISLGFAAPVYGGLPYYGGGVKKNNNKKNVYKLRRRRRRKNRKNRKNRKTKDAKDVETKKPKKEAN